MNIKYVQNFSGLAIYMHSYYERNFNLVIGNLFYKYQGKGVLYTLVKLEEWEKEIYGDNVYGLTSANMVFPRILVRIKNERISFFNNEKYEEDETVAWLKGAIKIQELNVLEDYKEMF